MAARPGTPAQVGREPIYGRFSTWPQLSMTSGDDLSAHAWVEQGCRSVATAAAVDTGGVGVAAAAALAAVGVHQWLRPVRALRLLNKASLTRRGRRNPATHAA